MSHFTGNSTQASGRYLSPVGLLWATVLLVSFALMPNMAWSQCTNCTTTTITGGDVVHTFTAGSGTFTPPEGITSIQYLVVAGGGGGGGITNIGNVGGAGGGGAGGLLSGTLSLTSLNTYNVTVGTGGTPGVGGSSPGGNGGASTFASITAIGGGGGGSVGTLQGVAGGSGGGGRLTAAGGNGTTGQGNRGGTGAGDTVTTGAAAGGGGAGAVGADGSGNTGGVGGVGVSRNITGTAIFYAGGGGGGGYNGANGGAGGNGGGAAAPNSRGAGANGTANRGGGGGGASGGTPSGPAFNGGAGGSGVVILRYTPGGTRYAVNNGNWNATNTWSSVSCSGASGASVPTAADNVVICNNRTVTLTAAAAAKSVTLETGNNDVNLNHNAGIALTLGSGGIAINGATGSNAVKSWNIGSGSAVVNGPVNLVGGNNSNRVARILLSSGTLDMNGSLSFNSNDDSSAVIESTGAANIFLAGPMTLAGGRARIFPGTSTFTFDGTGTQTALLGVSDINYHNLVFAGSGTKSQTSWSVPTITGTTVVNAGVTFNNSAAVIYGGEFINDGSTNASATQQYQGNFINNANYSATAAQTYRGNFTNTGTFTSGTNLHSFNGSAMQQITGTTTFFRMELNNAAGLTLNSDITAGDQLNLTNGVLITGSNVLRSAQAGGWSGVSRGTGWVAGNLGLWMPTGYQGRTFDVGDASAYRPVTLTIPNVTTAGYIVVSVSQSAGDHPQIASADLNPALSVNRWWSITSEGAAIVTMEATVNYLVSDLDAGVTPGNLVIKRFDGSNWNNVTAGSRTTTSAQATGINAFGQFAIAEPGTLDPSCDNLVSGIVGQYFNNTTLSGTATGTRIDGPINFNWGTDAPGVTGIAADQFSVRWEGLLRTTQTGNYQFQTVSDDGVRLWVNDVLVIDNWTVHAATTDTSGNIALTAGQTYSIRFEYYENFIDAEIRLRWRLPGAGAFVAIPAGPTPSLGAGLYHCEVSNVCATGQPTGGIEGGYFNNRFLTGSPTGTRVDGPIDFNWAGGAPGVAGVGADNFSVRWEGLLRAPESGNYLFQTVSDDGVRVWVDGVQIINNWTDHGAATDTSVNVALVAGEVYPIVMEYYENGGQSVARLRWRLPSSGAYVPIPSGPTPSLGGGLYYCPDAPVVAAYILNHNDTGITCEASLITVTAVDGSGNPIAPAAGTVVDLSSIPATGIWVGGSSYVFGGAEASFDKFLQQTTPATLTLTATDGFASGSSSIVFADVGLVFYDLPDLIDSMVAGQPYASATLRAVGTDPDTGNCETRVTGNQIVRFGYECLDPLTCSAGQSFTVNGTGIASNDSGTVANFTYVSLSLDATPIQLNFTDVGRVQLHAQLRLAAEGDDPEVTLVGVSSDFVVRPYQFVLTAAESASGVVNTGNSGFAAAGEAFRVVVQSQNASGGITPNYGNEQTPQGVTLRADTLVYPVGGVNGALTNVTNFVNTGIAGEFENEAVTWDEVGTLNLNAHVTGGHYLGAGDVVESPNLEVGRFYPHHFALTTSSNVEDSCTGFTYMSHPAMTVEYELVARNLNNAITTNYRSPGYAETATVSYVAENADDGTDLGSRVNLANPESLWLNGIWEVSTEEAMFERRPHQTLPAPAREVDGPLNSVQIGLRTSDVYNRPLQDPDMNPNTAGDCVASNSCDALMIGSPRVVRFGRLRLDDAFGPESVNLPVRFTTEYWNGSFFVQAATDDCTQIPRAAINYPAGNLLSDANRNVTLNGGSTQGIYAGLLPNAVGFDDGNAGHYFSAPGTGIGTFDVNIDLTDLPWLRFDWNQDGDMNDDAILRANFGFGQYRGHDRIIYWREDFQ